MQLTNKEKRYIIQPNYTFIEKNPKTHYLKVLKSDWHKQLILLENLVTEKIMKFYAKKGIITIHFSITTGSISSPMGKGSDSKPIKIKLEDII